MKWPCAGRVVLRGTPRVRDNFTSIFLKSEILPILSQSPHTFILGQLLSSDEEECHWIPNRSQESGGGGARGEASSIRFLVFSLPVKHHAVWFSSFQ